MYELLCGLKGIFRSSVCFYDRFPALRFSTDAMQLIDDNDGVINLRAIMEWKLSVIYGVVGKTKRAQRLVYAPGLNLGKISLKFWNSGAYASWFVARAVKNANLSWSGDSSHLSIF